MTPPLSPAPGVREVRWPLHPGFRQDVLVGLRSHPKTIPPKYFYDAEGSRLFEAITALPEYYPTRTELAIMEAQGAAICALLGPHILLVEFGSGSSRKTRLLLDQLRQPAGYVPIDISTGHLQATAAHLRCDYPQIPILPLAADYSQPFTLPAAPGHLARTVVYFPGSTIGNMEPATAREFLRLVRRLIGDTGALLIGVDLRKDPAILIPAYNDAQGVTAAFNRNLLARINRELEGNFRLQNFQHRAVWNAEASRIEMHLVSVARQRVMVAGERFLLEAGESICTEYSYKYTLESFATLASSAALRVDRVWTDDASLFSVQYVLLA